MLGSLLVGSTHFVGDLERCSVMGVGAEECREDFERKNVRGRVESSGSVTDCTAADCGSVPKLG